MAVEDTPQRDDDDFVGKRLPRTDGRTFVTGTARYVADYDLQNQAHLALVRSPHGHAEVVDVDVSHALATDGVLDVITGEDVVAETNPKGLHGEEYALAVDRVRYGGEPVAAVAAETEAIARDAAERVDVEYDRLDVVVDPVDALADDAPVVHPDLQDEDGVDGNVSQSFEQHVGDVEAGFEEADRIVERTYRFPALNGAPMEPHGCVVEYDTAEESITTYTTTQIMHRHKGRLADVFGLPANAVRVVQAEVGGAFGNKLNLLSHEICATLLSKRIDRPVKAVLTRQEHLETSKSSFAYVMDVKAGVTDDGTVTAWEEEILQDEGAYHASGLYIVGGAAANTRLLGYTIPNIHLTGKVVYTNRTPGAPVRGTGVRQLAFARESLLSELADDLGIDPIDLRIQQSVSNDECPYETPTGNVLSTTGMDAAIDAATDEIDYETTKRAVTDEEYTGIGVAIGYHVSSCRGRLHDADHATVDLRLEEDGSVTLATTACDMGTSPRTTLTQVCAATLGVDPEDVRVVDGDTQRTPVSDGSHSSRTMAMMGTATHDAATTIRGNLARMAAERLEAAPEDLEFAHGEVRVAGTDRSVSFETLAAAAHNDLGSLPEGMTAGDLSVEATFDTRDERVPVRTEPADEQALGNIAMDYPCSVQIVVASVDPATGKVTVEKHVVVDDVGTAVNPLVVEGQMEGGAVQGIGAALSERLEYDPDTGQPMNSNFSDYGIPTITDVLWIDATYVEVPSLGTAGGWKGVAEGPYIVAPAAIANAVCDAIGVRVTELPLTPERVKAAIEGRS